MGRLLSLLICEINCDPIIPLAVEHEGAIGYDGTFNWRAGLTVSKIANDLDIVNLKILACQESDSRKHA